MSSQGVQSKIHVAVERCVAIGLDLPTEPTSGHIVAVVLSIAQANVDPRASFGFVLDFKKRLKLAFKHGQGETSITDYPADPKHLPESRRVHAYGSEMPNPDANLQLPHSSIPLRRSSTTVRSTAATSLALPAAPDQTSMLGMMMMNFMQSHMSPNPNPINLQLLRPPSRKQLELPAGATASPPPSQLVMPLIPALTDGQESEVYTPNTKSSQQSPTPKTLLAPPEMSAEEQAEVVAKALADRKCAKDAAKDDEHTDDKKKAAKAKAKSKAKCKSTPKAKSQPSTKACKPTKTSAAIPVKSSISPKHKVGSSNDKTRPPPMKSGDPTVFYKGGKIHRSDAKAAWRVFINESDRCDKVPFPKLKM